jgi:hypothetical protein
MKRNQSGFCAMKSSPPDTAPPAEKGGTWDKGWRAIVDCGVSWRRFFHNIMHPILDLPLQAPLGNTQDSRRKDRKPVRSFRMKKE